MPRAKSPSETPVMRQYLSFKEKHPDAVLFFRMGDFYEMFFADAELAAKELGLTLTSRDKQKENGVPMAGVPYHAAEGYIAKLVRKGYRVAVCEQVGDPSRTKGLVERSITEIVTPGTALSDSLVSESANNYVATLLPSRDLVGLAAADITTGEFLLEDIPLERFEQDVARLGISEWVVAEGDRKDPLPPGDLRPVRRPGWWFDEARGRRELTAHFGVQSLAGFDCDDLGPALGAGGALLDYLREVRGGELRHLVRLRRLGIRDYMVLDAVTRRNLELTAPLMGESRTLTLLHTLDRTVTGLGARRLRAWLERPLVTLEQIERRLDAVQELVERPEEAEALEATLRRFRDLERLLGKAACGKAGPRDVRALGEGAMATPELSGRLARFQAPMLAGWMGRLPDLTGLGTRVTGALVDEPPLSAGDGGVFRPGFHVGLDEIRERARGGRHGSRASRSRSGRPPGSPASRSDSTRFSATTWR